MLAIPAIAFAVAFLVQLGKPFIKRLMPTDADWTNNVIRLTAFVVGFIIYTLNQMAAVGHVPTWAGLWNNLAPAGVIVSIAIATYHILSDATATTTSASVSVEAPPTNAMRLTPPPGLVKPGGDDGGPVVRDMPE